jgi:hypothetical protein
MATLQEIRAKLQALEDKKAGNKQSFGSSLVYPFWNVAENEPVQLRFLPNAVEDEENPYFWKEIQMINLEFPGVKGGDESKRVFVKVPCVEMWGDTCPVHAELRPWFKDPSLEATARKYWKKRSYIFQGFVIDNPIAEDAAEAPENPIRKFSIGPQIFNIIKEALMDPELDTLPTDYLNGINFRIIRTKKPGGEYNDYNTSSWSRKETPLTPEQAEAIEKYGLFNLNDWAPKKPTADGVNAIFEMFEASVEGDLYDPERWAKYYRPWGLEYEGESKPEGKTVELAATVSQTPAVETAEAPAVEITEEKETVTESPSASAPTSTSAQDILAKIRNRPQS